MTLARVFPPSVVCRGRLSLCVAGVLRPLLGLCVALVGMESLLTDIVWLDWEDDDLLGVV
jgi:hypothetical protein